MQPHKHITLRQAPAAASASQTAFVTTSGGVLALGANSAGNLGKDNTDDIGDDAGETAAAVPIVFGTTDVAVAVEVSVLATGAGGHLCAVFSNGGLRCWGKGLSGALGTDATDNIGDGTGVTMAALGFIAFGTTDTVARVSLGVKFSCAVFSNGGVRCWGVGGRLGSDSTATIGDGTGVNMSALSFIGFGTTHTATRVSASETHTCALFSNGGVRCWGYGSGGRLGTDAGDNVGYNTGEMAALGFIGFGTTDTVVQVAAGGDHSCAVFSNGGVRCWGTGSNGRLGTDGTAVLGDETGEMAGLAFIGFASTHTATQVSAGLSHTCVLFNNGGVRCFGENDNGRLGTDGTADKGGTAGDMAALGFISFGTTDTVTHVSAGYTHTCAIFSNSKARCWGAGDYGILGTDGTADKGGTAGDMAALAFIPFQYSVALPMAPTISAAFTVGFSAATFSVDEGGSVGLTVTASAASASSFSMTCTLTAGTATGSTDFDATAQSITFAAGATTASVAVTTVDDLLAEAAETFTATLSDLVDSTGKGSLSGTTTATVSIVDNDAFEAQLDAVSIESGVARIVVKRVPAEKQGAFTVTIDATPSSTARRLRALASAAVDFGATDATATALLPLEAGATGTLVFSITGVSGLGSTPSSSVTAGSTATTTLSAATTSTAATTTTTSTTFTIQFAASSFSGVEGQKMAVTLTRLPADSLGTATVDIAFGSADGQGDTATPHADYDAALRRVTFGQGVPTQTIYVDLVADAVPETTEHFSIRLAGISSSGAARASIGHPAAVVGFIEAVQVSFARAAYTAAAGQDRAEIGLVLSGAIGDPLTVSVEATAGSRTQAAQAVFAALATTASAVVDLGALGLGSGSGSAALRLTGLTAAATRDAGVSAETATLTVVPSGGDDGSLSGWEIPLVVLGGIATVVLAVAVALFAWRSWAARRVGSASVAAKSAPSMPPHSRGGGVSEQTSLVAAQDDVGIHVTSDSGGDGSSNSSMSSDSGSSSEYGLSSS
jgi:alpha-tubulin suppressor-like RCC1 family protein